VLVELRSWRWQMALTAGLLVLYWACLAFIPFHGHRGEYSEQGNLGILLDKAILNGWNYRWIVGGAFVSGIVIMAIAVGSWRVSNAPLSRKIVGLTAATLAVIDDLARVAWIVSSSIQIAPPTRGSEELRPCER
jgi:predicted acyltransferase